MRKHRIISLIPLSVVLSLLVVAVACGDEDTATPRATSTSRSPEATSGPTATSPAPTPTSPGVVIPTATSIPPTPTKPSPQGRLNWAVTSIGTGLFSPWGTGSPMYFLYKNIGLTETFWIRDEDGVIQGRLLEDWSISDDGLKWTLNLREGIPWHSQKGRGFGEWNAQDLEWNIIEGAREGSVVPPAPTNNALFTHEDGGYAIVDDYTVRVNTGVVRTDFQAGLIMPGTSQGMYSKQVFDQLGEDEGEETGVGTGPFEFVSFSTDEKLVLGAVEDHWRQTPAFAELVTWHMPDETTRLANFLTGSLDTYDRMNISNKPRLEGEPGVRFLVFPNLLSRIFLYGQYYPISGREPRAGH